MVHLQIAMYLSQLLEPPKTVLEGPDSDLREEVDIQLLQPERESEPTTRPRDAKVVAREEDEDSMTSKRQEDNERQEEEKEEDGDDEEEKEEDGDDEEEEEEDGDDEEEEEVPLETTSRLRGDSSIEMNPGGDVFQAPGSHTGYKMESLKSMVSDKEYRRHSSKFCSDHIKFYIMIRH